MSNLKWWQKAVFYQIYPRSFADGNQDGIGDLPGMIEKLDYLEDLGIDAIWLSPHYPSPLFDCGYDVANYAAVAPEYGALDDFRRLLDGCHQRGLRLILDLVLNHTSHLHPWFQESRSSRENPKRDWYVWRDGRAGSGGQTAPPNNWYSAFGGPAWENDPLTGQYYYHYFFKEQPDLNWRNPQVKQAVFDAARFWLELGVDGFRLDAIGTIFEDPAMPDQGSAYTQAELYRLSRSLGHEKPDPHLFKEYKRMYAHQLDQPEVHGLMRELRSILDRYDDRVLVGETDDIAYCGDGSNELNLVFNFPLMHTRILSPGWVRLNQRQRLSALPAAAWPCNTLGNHDSPRLYSRFGDGIHDAQLARLSLALMLTLRGTPFLYNGEEIGMTDWLLTELSQFRDMLGVWAYNMEKDILGVSEQEALEFASRKSRDKCRTPFQWGPGPNGGFCPADAAPWLPVNPNYTSGVNAADQDRDPASLLNFYRRLLRLRKQTPALIAGNYLPLHEESKEYLAFLRCSPSDHQTCLVVLNLSDQPNTLRFDSLPAGAEGRPTASPGELPKARLLFSSRERPAAVDSLLELSIAPWEIYIAELG